MISNIRSYLYNLFEGKLIYSTLGKWLNRFFVVLILLNVIAVLLDSEPQLHEQYYVYFINFEYFSVFIFTIEYVIRIFIAADKDNPENFAPYQLRLKYIFSPIGIIDLLTILPFYLSVFTQVDLRFLRLFRILRLLKLSHYFRGLNLFMTVIRKEASSISSAIFTMFVLVIISAGLMYNLEHHAQPDVFSSIPAAIWWAVVTMTTVGYGDVTPITFAGKILAIFIMLLGVGIVALPAAMLAARFGDELQSRKKQLTAHVIQALSDGHVSELEKQDLKSLCDKLEISEEELHLIIDAQTIQTSVKTTCPHCNKNIYE
jgi:voltage-gated potassium channel